MAMIRGKNFKGITTDIAEGYVTVNPLFLKPLDDEQIKGLNFELMKTMKDIRSRFPNNDQEAIRERNLRLVRLNNASTVLRNYARTKKILLV